MATLVFKVSIPNTHRDWFDYLADEKAPCVGARVWVPFRNQTRMGVVVGSYTSETPRELKSIADVIDTEPLLSKELLALCEWVGTYYQSPLSEVIPLVLPKKYRHGTLSPMPLCSYYQIAVDEKEAYALLRGNAKRQKELVDYFIHHQGMLPKKTILLKGYNATLLNGLVERGILLHSQQMEKPRAPKGLREEPHALHPEQQDAVESISAHLDHYRCTLLQGVTGSGKTEVYLQVIAKVLAAGKQVLVLVPEIGLTPQLLARFRDRFQEPMAVIHSSINDADRQLSWLWAKEQAVNVVIGTRSAVFTPMKNLGLIVVDEEHDASFKQMEGVRYSARDTALIRAHMANVPIVLGSATPSLESLHNAMRKKYTLLRLTHKALSSTPLHYQITDIRNQTLQHGLATPTMLTIREHLDAGNQVLVFINRRGFAPVLLCHQCGWMAGCRACDAHLTVHRQIGRLICHHCGLIQNVPNHCGSCKSQELTPIGAGTQRIQEYLSEQFPERALVRIDRDEVRKKKAFDERLADISEGRAELIVGTQMLAKGHHFPNLTLVVILDTDNGFYNQDFRALERLGQLITQVAGRAGRAEFPGQVVIQTHLPQHPLLNVLVQQGYDAFAEALLTLREASQLPPFHFLTMVRAQGKALPKVLDFLHAVKEQLHLSKLNVLGPAPAPLSRKAGHHRMQLLVKSSSRNHLKLALTALREWLFLNKIGQGVRWNVDVDPVDLS